MTTSIELFLNSDSSCLFSSNIVGRTGSNDSSIVHVHNEKVSISFFTVCKNRDAGAPSIAL
jgi:hypothetical protein